MKWLIMWILVWMILSFLNFGALNARDKYWHHRYKVPMEMDDVSFNTFIALIPLGGTIVTIVVTGFCHHGFSWRIEVERGD